MLKDFNINPYTFISFIFQILNLQSPIIIAHFEFKFVRDIFKFCKNVQRFLPADESLNCIVMLFFFNLVE